ncbi:MAG: hypothetical protein IJZ35_05150 [Clostridia bacterium]|nr:hypothetical protein [Clostridia bacterium]
MFIGAFPYTITDSNDNSTNSRRIVMVPRFRTELGSEFQIFLRDDGCLRLYTNDRWNIYAENMSERLEAAEMGMADAEDIDDVLAEAHGFFGNVYDGKMDKQGRISLTSQMLQHANIQDDIVIVGMNRFIEIWNPDEWEKAKAKKKEKVKK